MHINNRFLRSDCHAVICASVTA